MKGKLNKSEWILIGVIIFVVIAWVANLIILYDKQDAGRYGDLFGASNALFSGLAFAGVIWAILQQGEELKLQRQELALTRETLREQKDQIADQTQTFKKQNFEDTFFALLDLHRGIVDSLRIDYYSIGKTIQVRGRECIGIFLRDDFREQYKVVQREMSDAPELDKIRKAYNKFFESRQAEVGHYFRTLYNIIKFIKNSDVKDKQLYVNLIRAQLSSSELGLLFYNCLSDLGREKFKPLVEEFRFLKNMPDNVILSLEHKQNYNSTAFGA